jgi:hypothetical protein
MYVCRTIRTICMCVLCACRRHAQGLALLQQLSQQPEGMAVPPTGAAADLKGLPGVWAAVRWVLNLHILVCASCTSSIKRHSLITVLP